MVCAASVYGAETEESLQRSVAVSSGTHLRLNADFGSVSLKPAAGHSVDVNVLFRGDPPSRREFDRMMHDFSLKLNQQGTEVSVEAVFIHGWEPVLSFLIDGGLFSGHSMCREWRCLTYSRWLDEVEIRVAVPAQFNTYLNTSGGSIAVSEMKGEVTAHTSGGWLRFDHVEGRVNGTTSGGGIDLRGVSGKSSVHTSGGWIRMSEMSGDVEASTSGGWISIDTASGRIKAHTSGGWIDAKAISGPIDVSTSGGGVNAALVAQPREDCRFSTSGGGITVTLPGDAKVDLDASTSGGSVTTDFPVPRNGEHDYTTLRTSLNGGGPLVYMHTSGGGIHLKKSGGI